MNIKKIGSGLIVAMSMLAFNAAASDKCEDEIANIKAAAENLRCTLAASPDFGYPTTGTDNIGLWDHEPIWQKEAGKGKGKGKNSDPGEPGDGCEVHAKLARLLYEEPVVKAKGNNPAKQGSRGAARALEDHQYTYAIQLLAELKASIDTSVLNPDPDWGTVIDNTPDGPIEGDAQYWADVYWKFADDMQGAIDDVKMVCYSDINP